MLALVCLALYGVAGADSRPRHFTADLVKLDDTARTRYDDVVENLEAADPRARTRFAEVALQMLIDAYESEIAAGAATPRGGQDRPAGWLAGTRHYVERLKQIAASLDGSTDVRAIREHDGTVRLVIGREQVMLSAPRLDDQRRFERAVATLACDYVDCEAYGRTLDERVAERTADVDSTWEFSNRKPPVLAASDGLRCVFADERHLRLKRVACERLLRELRVVSETIAALYLHGRRVDWESLHLEHVGPDQPEKFVYTARGDFVRIHVPGLLRADDVWRGSIPWVRARAQTRTLQHVVRLPDDLVYFSATNNGDHEIR